MFIWGDIKKRICPRNSTNKNDKNGKKKRKYQDLARELKKLLKMKVTIIAIVIGALGTITKWLVLCTTNNDYLDLARELEKPMKHENDSDSICNSCAQYSYQMFGTRSEGLGNKRTSGDHPKDSIIKIGQNTEKCPGDLRRLVVTQTQMRNHRPTPVWKTQKGVTIPFLKWTREELKQMEQRTRKLMTMHKALHPRDDVDKLYVSRKEGGRGLASIEDTVDAFIQRLEDDIEKHERGLITTVRNDIDNTIDERVTTTRKQKWEGKQLYGRFKRLINNISHLKTWTWLRKGKL